MTEAHPMTSIDKLEPCPFCGSVPTPLSDSRVSSNCDPACPCADMSCLTQRWNTRSLTPQAGEGVERACVAFVDSLEEHMRSYPDEYGKISDDRTGFYHESVREEQREGIRNAMRAAIAALPPAGRVEEMRELLIAACAFVPQGLLERISATLEGGQP